MNFECKPCGVTWSGHNTSHCHRCGLVFVGLGSFDKHLDRVKRVCKTPESVGLELAAERSYPVYGPPRGEPDTPTNHDDDQGDQ